MISKHNLHNTSDERNGKNLQKKTVSETFLCTVFSHETLQHPDKSKTTQFVKAISFLGFTRLLLTMTHFLRDKVDNQKKRLNAFGRYTSRQQRCDCWWLFCSVRLSMHTFVRGNDGHTHMVMFRVYSMCVFVAICVYVLLTWWLTRGGL